MTHLPRETNDSRTPMAAEVLPFLRRRAPGLAASPAEHLEHSVQDAEALEKRAPSVWRAEVDAVNRGEFAGAVDPASAHGGATFIKHCTERIARLDDMRDTEEVTARGADFVQGFDRLVQSLKAWLEYVARARAFACARWRRPKVNRAHSPPRPRSRSYRTASTVAARRCRRFSPARATCLCPRAPRSARAARLRARARLRSSPQRHLRALYAPTPEAARDGPHSSSRIPRALRCFTLIWAYHFARSLTS